MADNVASRSQISPPNTGEHRTLDRLGLLRRRGSGFALTGSGSVVLASRAQRQCRLGKESSTGLDGKPLLPHVFFKAEVSKARGEGCRAGGAAPRAMFRWMSCLQAAALMYPSTRVCACGCYSKKYIPHREQAHAAVSTLSKVWREMSSGSSHTKEVIVVGLEKSVLLGQAASKAHETVGYIHADMWRSMTAWNSVGGGRSLLKLQVLTKLVLTKLQVMTRFKLWQGASYDKVQVMTSTSCELLQAVSHYKLEIVTS